MPANSTKPKSSYIPVAPITLTVTDFRDVENTAEEERGTVHRMELEVDKHPRVSRDPNDASTLKIRKGDARLRFTIKSEDKRDKKATFYPVGIAFRLRGAGDGKKLDRIGRATFWRKPLTFDGRSLTVYDDFSDVGPRKNFKFSVIIQRDTDGAIGIIDPGIEHEDPNNA
jgi:hypothetical protein